jgi:two-component system, OmpR family, alkaline phosphatase synthesis response regulator PhoP
MMELVFLVEIGPATGRPALDCLQQAGYSVRALQATDAIDAALCSPPSLIVIDDAAGDDGLKLCRDIRQNSVLARIPVVILIDGETVGNGVAAMNAGADDCVTQPFVPRELIVRVQAVLRRSARRVPIPIAECTDIVIDNAAMKLSVRGDEVETTTLQFRLLDYLARHRGKVFTRDVLLDAVWGDMQFVNPRSVDACIRRVRNKIEPDTANPTYLKTIRGVGYRFDAIATWPNSNENCNCAACKATTSGSRASYAVKPQNGFFVENSRASRKAV